MWYTGIDWADEHHDAMTIDEKGHQVGSIRVDHTPQGFARLDTFLMQIVGSAPKEQMACIIETTHGLMIVHLLEAGLSTQSTLERLIVADRPLEPKLI